MKLLSTQNACKVDVVNNYCVSMWADRASYFLIFVVIVLGRSVVAFLLLLVLVY